MQQRIMDFLQQHGMRFNEWTLLGMALVIIIFTAVVVHMILHKLVLVRLENFSQKTNMIWLQVLTENQLFSRIAFIIQGMIVLLQTTFWLRQGVKPLIVVMMCAKIWVLIYLLLAIFSFLDIVLKFSHRMNIAERLPLRGIFQGIKLLAALIFGILILSVLINKSPLILISGLGAMAAVIMLVFKDSILGLAAGVQLSANSMLRVNDWLQMPKYGADGMVMDIGLTTVKVRNFDNTVTMIPTYALVSDSFTNWRAMQESGGRRIKRSIYVDVTTIRFLTDEELEKLAKSELLGAFITSRKEEIRKDNEESHADLNGSILNGRRMTNFGLYRQYLDLYLKKHPKVRNDMMYMVRQMAPEPNGVPLEIYCFSNTVVWKDYETIQSDIFDHAYAVIEEFYLSAYQNPSGNSSTVTVIQDPSNNPAQEFREKQSA